MAEETSFFDNLTRGHHFDGGPFALDLYRLLAMVLADKQIAELADEASYHEPPEWQLQDRFRKSEVIRILVSSAVALRILLDQDRDVRDTRFKTISKRPCGTLWPTWDKAKKRAKGKPKPLTVRDACNKIIHAKDVVDDIVIPDRRHNPDELGVYLKPFVYLYGTQNKKHWRAKLSILEFVPRAALVFLDYMP